jgi:hypothetical protein
MSSPGGMLQSECLLVYITRDEPGRPGTFIYMYGRYQARASRITSPLTMVGRSERPLCK